MSVRAPIQSQEATISSKIPAKEAQQEMLYDSFDFTATQEEADAENAWECLTEDNYLPMSPRLFKSPNSSSTIDKTVTGIRRMFGF